MYINRGSLLTRIGAAFNTVTLHTFMRGTFNTNRGLPDKHCSTCKHYWTGHGQMYCTAQKARITAGRKNGCKLYKHYGEDNIR